ncbi:MAG: DUF58 domain-containing protein [Bacteroidia bacterium]|nr:DUF58 domain-containing protein [Bacteroidia bacterium]MCZ2249193.1 DUF58 domain-containing protein [Bacteroidia bacterium]
MESSELIKKVRKIEIKSRGLSNQIFSGEYHSKFKGQGMAFSEVREYQPGDDIRTIDWNVTARFNHPFVKIYEEEREMTVMLLVDISASGNFGTKKQLKQDLLTEICAVLAFSAMQNNDKIGVIFFTDKVEKFIPPKKGRTHVLRIIRELIEFKPSQQGTDISVALRYFTNMIKKRCTAFLISDFIDNNFEDALKITSRKHDLVAIRLYDEKETEIPAVGLLNLKDAETGKSTWVDTSSKDFRAFYKAQQLKRQENLVNTFRKNNIDNTSIATHQNYVRPLIELFKRREK